MTEPLKVLNKELKMVHWGPGEWIDEPDLFEFEHEGFVCFGIRMAIWDGFNLDYLYGGFWCGYVIIPTGHPWHGLSGLNEFQEVEVHGGVSHYGFDHLKEGYSLGFDCGHSGDVVPSMVSIKNDIRQETINYLKSLEGLDLDIENSCIFRDYYRNYDYVVEQTKSLADQAKKAQDEALKSI